MNNHRGIYFVLLLIFLISVVYWTVVYHLLHQPDFPSEADLFSLTEPVVRVRIINTQDSLTIDLLADYRLSAGPSQPAMDFMHGTQISIAVKNAQLKIRSTKFTGDWMADSISLSSVETGGELEIKNVPYGIGWSWAGEETRIYSGKVSIKPLPDENLQVIVELPLEQYLRGVAPYEIGADSPFASLQAQAVAARSEAVMALLENLYSGPGYDLTSDVECQVFAGNKKSTAEVDSAIASTRGLILFSETKPIHAYYSSNCGGHSEKIENVWPQRDRALPYRRGHFDTRERIPIKLNGEKMISRWLASDPDVYCNPSHYSDIPEWSAKNFRWTRQTRKTELNKLIGRRKQIGKIKSIKVLHRGVSGRISKLVFIGESDSLLIQSELAIRQIWQPPLKSACFIVREKANLFIFKGAGWGHGVGMCQTGAITQARLGIPFDQVLNHYYRGSQLHSIY